MSRYIDADELHNQGWVAARYINWEPTPLNDNFRLEVEVKPFTTFYAVDVAPRWISVTERLPEKYGKYLVTVDMDYYVAVITLYYGRINCKDVFYDSDSEYGDIEYRGVIAWMPLPEPYKKGE